MLQNSLLMDVLDKFSLMYQVSRWLLIKKRKFAVVGSEMSVPFSVCLGAMAS